MPTELVTEVLVMQPDEQHLTLYVLDARSGASTVEHDDR
jgi:hypothetical protein